jgi:hypothetical protein
LESPIRSRVWNIAATYTDESRLYATGKNPIHFKHLLDLATAEPAKV